MEPPLETLSGSCFCGHTQYTIRLGMRPISPEAEPALGNAFVPSNLTLTAYCHCTNCQRLNGCPFVWTTHWKQKAIEWHGPKASTEPEINTVGLPQTVDIFESMPGRKLKIRCKRCGSPVGSYSISKDEWTIWGTTIERESLKNFKSNVSSVGSNSSSVRGWKYIKPTTHQFYGTRIMDIVDDLSRWEGYEGCSARLDM